MAIDPLTCDYAGPPPQPFKSLGEWWDSLQAGLCDCGRQPDEYHSDVCSISPIYAEMVWAYDEDGDAPWQCIRDIADARLAMIQHVIRCADCGAERLGKDLQVIYRAPSSITDNPDGRAWYKPKYAVKAICLQHIRRYDVWANNGPQT